MATRIKIEDIIRAKGVERKRKLALFLNGCTERQRCFLAFVSTNPILTSTEDALSDEELGQVSASCKDKDTFMHYVGFTCALRDLWLKYEGSRQQMKKALCYFTACECKIHDALDAAEACNKSLQYIPDDKKKEAGDAMAAILDKGDSISMESDVFAIAFHYDEAEGKMIADVEEAQIIKKEAFDVYKEFVSDVKAYERVFIELSKSDVVGNDGSCIFEPLLYSFEQLKSSEAFSVYSYLPPYEEMPLYVQDYTNIKHNVEEWIGNK